ncbi:MAG: hypothetical protein HOQ43_10930 [Glycomyces artemisiae]|uniref:Phage tail tape measure protein domain-containing protein n=1 Tax=Glycomyces artemisiae TaxID=1076443 RepID=A0A850C3Q6_9ACTN|nr:hypothetical protein [Glycomyces artemisiae]
MALNIGELVGTLALDGSEFRGGLDGALGDFDAFGGKLGAAAGIIGGAAGAALAVGFLAADMEAGTDKIAASLNLVPAEAERVGEVAANVFGAGFGSGMDEVNLAIENIVAQMGDLGDVTDAELEGATEDALNLAKVMGTDVARVTQIAGQSVKNGMAKDFDEAFDLIAAASAETMPNLREDLLDALDEYGPMLDGLGLSGERAFGLLAKASEKGMYGIDKTGDALKEFTLLSTNASDSTNAVYESIGLDAEAMADSILAGGDKAGLAFDKIVNGLIDIKDPSDQAAAAIALFGTPLEDLNVSEIPAFLEGLSSAGSGLDDVAGSADDMGATLNDNATSNLSTFGRSMQMWFVDVVGGKVLPVISSVASFLATNLGPTLSAIVGWITSTAIPAFQSFAQWVGANQVPIMIVAGAITLFFLPAIIAAGVQSSISGGKMVATWIATKLQAMGSSIAQAAALWRIVAAWVAARVSAVASGVVIAAQWVAMQAKAVASVAVQAGQFGLLIAQWVGMQAKAVAATVVVIAQWVAQKAAALLNTAVTVAAVIAGWVSMNIASLAGAAAMAIAWIIAFAPVAIVIAIIVGLVVLIVMFWDEIVAVTKMVFTAVWEWIKGAFDKVMEIIHGVIDWVSENWPLLLAIITGPFGLALYFIIKFKDDIIAGIKYAVDWVIGKFGDLVDWVKALPGKIGKAASGLWDSLTSTFKSAINALIRIWNDFSLTIGGGNILGVDIPSVTLNTPDLPYLATGGTALTAGAAIVGERGPEIRHLPQGATVETLEHAASRTRVDALARDVAALGQGRAGVTIEGDAHFYGVATGDPDEDIMRAVAWGAGA